MFCLFVVNTSVQIFPHVSVFHSCGNLLRSEIAAFYDNFKFNYLKNCHTVSHCGYSVLHFHWQYKSFSLIASLTVLVIYWLFVK